MAKYKVKAGAHYIGDNVYKVGDVFECDNDALTDGDGARMFTKIVEHVLDEPATGGTEPSVEDDSEEVPVNEVIAPTRRGRRQRKTAQ